MSKQIKAKVRLQLSAAAANPAPPVGSTLGPHGINLMKFCTEFNNATKDKKGDIIPVVVTIYVDKTFDIEYKTPPVSDLIKKHAKVSAGASKVGKEFVGSLTEEQVTQIARIKMQDLNTVNLESACNSVRGSARSMGIRIVS
jgi:large subunit ribosomal protein L11